MIEVEILAGSRLEFHGQGNFFRIIDSYREVDVRFYHNGAEISQAKKARAGYSESFYDQKFDKVSIESGVSQVVTFVVKSGGAVGFDPPPVGDVTIKNPAGPWVNSLVNVSNVSAAELIAASTERRYILIQNNSLTVPIWVRVDSLSPTVGNGIKITPGGSWEIVGFAPSGSVKAIAEGAINNNVNVVYG